MIAGAALTALARWRSLTHPTLVEGLHPFVFLRRQSGAQGCSRGKGAKISGLDLAGERPTARGRNPVVDAQVAATWRARDVIKFRVVSWPGGIHHGTEHINRPSVIEVRSGWASFTRMRNSSWPWQKQVCFLSLTDVEVHVIIKPLLSTSMFSTERNHRGRMRLVGARLS